jgi:PAS domain S-box-containing protein
MTGSALLAVTTLATLGSVARGVHTCAGLALLGLALGFARTGNWTGLVFYSVLGAATMLAGFRPPAEQPYLVPPRELLDLAAGSAAALIGASLLLLPEQFGAASYDPIRSVLPAFGMAFLASGGLLLIAQVRLAERWWRWVAHVTAAATFFGFAVAVAWPQHALTGVLLYAGTGIMVLLQPWLGPRLGTGRAPALRTRLTVALCAVATVPLVIAIGLLADYEESATTDQVLTLHHAVASGLAHDVDGDVTSFVRAATTVASTPDLLGLPPAGQAAVLRSVTLVPSPRAVATFDAAGNGVARSDDAPLTRISASSLYESVRRTQAPAYALTTDLARPGPIFQIAAPIRDSRGALAGLVVLEFASFPTALASAETRPGGRTYLLNPGGRAIVQMEPGVLAVIDMTGSPLIPPANGPPDPTGERKYSANSQDMLAGFATVPSLGWRVVVERPEAVALADVRTGRELVFGVLLLAALLAVALGALIGRQMAAPLQVLVRAVQELGAGAPAAPLPESAIPEVAQLAASFASMRTTLTARTSELANLAAIVQSSDEAITSNTLDGTLTSWNQGAELLYGYAAAEMIGQSIRRVRSPERPADPPSLLERVRETGQVQRRETVHVHKDGHRLDLSVTVSPIRDAAGSISGVAAITRDIGERRRAEAQLRASEQQLEEAARIAHLGHWAWDLGTDRLTWSAEHYRIFGREPCAEGLAAAEGLAQIHPDDRAVVDEAVACTVRDGTPFDLEVRIVRPDGAIVSIESRGSRQVDAAGTAVRLTGTAQEITERKIAEAALRKSEEQLRQSQRMEGIGLLAGGIAHDFNNLLTAIIGFSELALGSVPEASPVRPMISEVRMAGERAAVLTRQLLAFSRQQVLQPKIVDLNTIVGNMELLLTRVIGEDVDLASIPATDLGRVFVDPSQVEQIIMNLAVNARDAMPIGGKLTIMTANVDVAPEASATSDLAVGAYVLLAVSDTGTGMDVETMARIFEPFFTTKELGKGTGLGLATVYGIIKQSGGEIRVYTEPGQGTTFKIYLPRKDAGLGASEVGAIGTEPARGGVETILLVEDEAAVRALATSVLESTGYTVLVATSGEEGLKTVQGYPGHIDLLLTDVVMPGGSGVDLARQATELRPTLRVLFMSGYPGEIAVRHGLLETAAAYLGKPFTPHVLSRKVREILDGRSAAAELDASARV